MSKIFCTVLLFLLISCASTPTPTAIISPIEEKVVKLDPRAYEACENLRKVSTEATFDEFIEVTISNYELYAICAKKQLISIKLLKEFSNYKGVD